MLYLKVTCGDKNIVSDKQVYIFVKYVFMSFF